MSSPVKTIIPVSFVIATADRPVVFRRMLDSLFEQDFLPKQIIVVDASKNDLTKSFINKSDWDKHVEIRYENAIERGAAVQRNQGLLKVTQPFITFIDDDILLEKKCIEALYKAISSNDKIGGVNAFVTNQHSVSPGKFTRFFYYLLRDRPLDSYDGRCFGPVVNVLPADHKGKVNMLPVDWLNSTCTFYRREALPEPVFDKHFTGYSFMEDVALSLRVGKNWQLFNVQEARIFHDSQTSDHKKNIKKQEKMELVNRHYVMTKVLARTRFKNYVSLFVLEVFNMLALLRNTNGIKKLPSFLSGKLAALRELSRSKTAGDV